MRGAVSSRAAGLFWVDMVTLLPAAHSSVTPAQADGSWLQPPGLLAWKASECSLDKLTSGRGLGTEWAWRDSRGQEPVSTGAVVPQPVPKGTGALTAGGQVPGPQGPRCPGQAC